MSKFTVEIEVPAGLKAGDKFQVEVETPASEKKARGQLAGIPVPEMSTEQLKRELINANSVLYKAKQRGASADTINANQARVDTVKAEIAKRTPAPAATAQNVTGAVEGTPTDANTAAEI